MFQGAGSFSPMLPELFRFPVFLSARSSVPFPASWSGFIHHPRVIRLTNTSRGVPAFRESHLIETTHRRNAKRPETGAFVSILSAPWQNDHSSQKPICAACFGAQDWPHSADAASPHSGTQVASSQNQNALGCVNSGPTAAIVAKCHCGSEPACHFADSARLAPPDPRSLASID